MADLSSSVQGVTGEYTGSSFAVRATIIALLSCALSSAIELILLIFLTFRRYHGLYFWSLLISTLLGVIPQALGLLLKYFALAPLALSVTSTTFGWAIMVTGQSLVLYSRLHLIVRETRVLRLVLYMIIVDAIILQIPQIIFSYAVIFGNKPSYPHIYNIWERLQLTGFFVQEVIISTIFIVQAMRLLDLYPNKSQKRVMMMYQLLIMNVGIILMDISLLVLEYMNQFIIQTVLKTLLYTVKLKFEFAVLSRLVSFVSSQNEESSNVQPLASGTSKLS